MFIPLSGIIFIPLSLAVFFGAPSRLGQLAIVSAVFAAAAVVNFGDANFPFGISPFFFVALLIGFRRIPAWLNGGFRTTLWQPLRRHLRMLVAFVGWAVFSAALFPFLFRSLPVDLARAGPDETYYSRMPLHWSLSNAGQAGYLLLNLTVILYLLERIRTRADLDSMCSAVSGAGVIVVIVGAYQWLAHRAGLPFPVGLFNSNPAWAQLANQDLGGLYRISATFDESSGAGSYLAAWVSFEFVLGTGPGTASWRHLAFALAGVLMVIATTSTTGYVTTAIMLSINLLRCTLGRRPVGRNRALLAGFILIAGAAVTIFALTGQRSTLLDAVMLDKAHSGSALHRTATVVRSIDVFAATYGLGAGLGSNRAMSIIAYIISNLGIIGTMLFVWLLASLAAMSRSVGSLPDDGDRLPILHEALSMAFLARLLALSEAGAEITDPIMWLFWGIFLAAIRQRGLMRSINVCSDVCRDPVLVPAFEFKWPIQNWPGTAYPKFPL